MLLTFQDSVERLVDYLGGEPSDAVLRDAKKAVISALRDITQCFTWTYLYEHGRITTSKSYDCGLVTYLPVGGQVPNQLTLVGGCWPDWSMFGTVRLFNTNFDVAQRLSGTVLQLSSPLAPSYMITNPTAYGIFRDTYTMPENFQSQDQTIVKTNWTGLDYVHPREWLMETATIGIIGDPIVYTFMADDDFGGRLCMKLAPFPTEPREIDYIYKRRANALNLFRSNCGTVATGVNSKTIQGTGTAFTTQMADVCVVRVSGNNKPPTSEWGDNPAVFESKIVAVNPATQMLTLLEAAPAAYAAAPYTISNWLDITTGTMSQAFERCCEMHISMTRVLKDKPSARLQYEAALEVAKCADCRVSLPRTAGVPAAYRRRLKDYPISLQREV